MAAALMAGAAFFVLLLFVLTFGFRLIYYGRIFPGVTVAGVDVSGLNREQAAAKLKTSLTFLENGRIMLSGGQSVWTATPAEMGAQFNADSSAQEAFDFGRGGTIFHSINDELNAWQVGVVLPPIVIFDQGVAFNYLQKLAPVVEKPVVEASLVIDGLTVTSQPGQVGYKLDIDSTLVYLHAQIQAFRDGEVPLVMQEIQPQVLDASAQADSARKLLSAPFTILLPDAQKSDPGPWLVQPPDLAPMLRVGRLGSGPGSKYVVQFDQDKLNALLETIIKQVDRPATNARFLFNEQTGQISATKPSLIGLSVDLRGSLDEIQKAVGSGQQTASLHINTTTPEASDTATGQQLGIKQLISSQTTYFFGSSDARRKNIQTAAANFNGLLVAPGETFSMGQYMSDVTLDNGYAEALIIYNGKTIKGVGGGVCQVSTTLFRTVFYAGFPVVERHAHAYRVLYYEQAAGGRNDPNLSGFDATVYFPLVDFKFKNDTPYWLLMETLFDSANSSLTWKMYSTPDGRTVQATFSGPTNIVPALPPTITYNPDAPSGSVNHVDYAAQGADITITRNVLRDNQPFFTDSFVTKYEPWADACEYGPNVKDPEKILKGRGWCQIPG